VIVERNRRAEYAATTRTAILAAATEQFALYGFAKCSIDAIAVQSRVTKGAIYHHFRDKTALFEAVFVALEDELMAAVLVAVASRQDPLEQIATGIDLFLDRCTDPVFRRVALEEAPAALGWPRWKELEETRFHALVAAGLGALPTTQPPDAELLALGASMVLAALGEAGLAVARAHDPRRERQRAGALVMRMIVTLHAN
jgi:AcrR family transcriptional regulator